MSERWFSQGRPIVVAHRGASSVETENTLPAFEAAISAGADAIEFDVRMTADGSPVVMHDPDVGRLTNGIGLVRDLRLVELKRLRISTVSGETVEVPTLQEALLAISGRAGVDIEIKNIPGEPDFDAERELAVEATLETLEASGFRGGALISSFNPLSIARSRLLAPDVPTGLLTTEDVDGSAAFAYARDQGHEWVLPFERAVREAGPGLARDVHAANMRLGTWIVDDPEVALTMMREGVDAIATNDPAAVVVARSRAFG